MRGEIYLECKHDKPTRLMGGNRCSHSSECHCGLLWRPNAGSHSGLTSKTNYFIPYGLTQDDKLKLIH